MMTLKKKSTRILSALLCLCMIVGILPAGVAPVAKAAAGDISIDLSSTAVSATSGSSIASTPKSGNWNEITTEVEGDWVAFDLGTVGTGKYDGKIGHIIAFSGGKAAASPSAAASV